MKRNIQVISISLMIILTSIVIIFFEMKSYTPIDKDESEVIENYDVVTKRMEDKIKTRKAKEEKRIKQEEADKEIVRIIKQVTEETKTAEAAIKKYRIKKILNLHLNNSKKAEKILCDYHNCEAMNKNWMVDDIYAIEFDFNNDGVNEIMGYWKYNYAFYGPCIEILEKNKDKYERLFSECNIVDNIQVLNHKTNGYYDIVYKAKNVQTEYKILKRLKFQ